MTLQFILDGIVLKDGIDYNMSAFSISQRNDNEKPTITAEFKFKGRAYDLIRAKLIDKPTYEYKIITEFDKSINQNVVIVDKSKFKGLSLIVKDLCCNNDVIVLAEIRADTLKFCDNICTITGTPINATPNSKFLDLIKSQYIFDNDFIREKTHPNVFYQDVTSEWVWHILCILFISLQPALLAISILSAVVGGILKVVGFFTGNDKLRDINLDNFYFLDDIIKWITGLGKFHPTPLVRDYINSTVEKCNGLAGTTIKFESSILNSVASPYYDMLYYFPQRKKGVENFDKGIIEENAPLKTLSELLNDLKTVFNADWKIIDNTLHFERRDFFKGKVWELRNVKSCYDIKEETYKAAIEIDYSPDGADIISNTNTDYYFIETFNPSSSFNPRQKGIDKINPMFGLTRQRDDQFGKDVIAFYSFFFPEERNYRHVILQEDGVVSTPKLLVWSFDDGTVSDFNRALYGDKLYERFYFINNPRLQVNKPFTFEMSYKMDCNNKNIKITDLVTTKEGISTKLTEINFEYMPTRKITVRGEL